jgi:hypothetical protein
MITIQALSGVVVESVESMTPRTNHQQDKRLLVVESSMRPSGKAQAERKKERTQVRD